MNARQHARRAGELLDSVADAEKWVDQLNDVDRLQAAATGQISRYNAAIMHTVQLAQSHALTALALAAAGVGEDG